MHCPHCGNTVVDFSDDTEATHFCNECNITYKLSKFAKKRYRPHGFDIEELTIEANELIPVGSITW